MKYFLSFMGYPRSGHTLVAAILNANPNVICSNQQNFYGNVKNISRGKLLKDIKLGSVGAFYKDTTQIPHIPKQEITVMGDKTGHRTVDILGNNPKKLGMMKNLIQVPMKWIHVVRNPYDNLATWAKLNYINKIKKNETTERIELDLVIQKYRVLNETITKLRRSEDVLTVNHEFLITRMHDTLLEISKFLEISFDPIWRDNVRNTAWSRPRITRGQITWSIPQKEAVETIIGQYDWLSGYEFGGCGRC